MSDGTKQIQKLLLDRGYNVSVDGVYGPNTETAILLELKKGLTPKPGQKVKYWLVEVSEP